LKKIIVFLLAVAISGCGSVKVLSKTNKSPKLHDNYEASQNKRIYGVLPLPFGFFENEFVKFTILKKPTKGEINLLDDFKGFFHYIPKEGMSGYDYLVYKVSNGKKVEQKIIQIDIK